MCGIAGFVDFSGHREAEAGQRVRRMADAIIHRGPDEGGYYVDGLAAFGHRRLSIVDLSSGQQPMSAGTADVHIVFNGEIYNFEAIRSELQSLGHSFRTHSDTEVILRAYLQWGESCVERFNGMFAFAIWDAPRRILFLARDRVGKKPLYVYRNGSVIAFASEIKALRAGGFGGGALDAQSLDCYLTFGYIPAPRTIYRNISKLPAARTLLAGADSHVERRYWKLRFGEVVHRSIEEAAEEFDEIFTDAVNCRLMGEVPLGAFLSGGIDSSLVVECMSRLMGKPVITNSIGFDDPEVSELSLAKKTAAQMGTDHHEFIVEPRADRILERVAWHLDEPLADSSAIPTWYVCEMARRTVTVALSGDGGDEAFGGYTFRYVPHVLESRIRSRLPAAIRGPVFGALGALWPASSRLPRPLRLKTIFENLSVGDAEAFYHDLAWLRPEARAALYRPEFAESLRGFEPSETALRHYHHNDAPDALSRSQYADVNFYMTDDVLAKVDRMSMAHSLEVRAPLLDYRVLEFAARLPPQLKIRGRQGKVLLRHLAAKRLPSEILTQPKRGFSIPAARWLREDLRPMFEGVAFSRRGVIADILDEQQVRRLWKQHLDGSRDHHVFLWGLMMLGLWEAGQGTAAQ